MKIFIGCSGSDKISEKYINDCKILISKLFENNHELVFGGSNLGLMGLSYDIAKENERNVIGICPEAYKRDFKNLDCNSEIITESICERTNKLIEYSDIIIFLPGGIGTAHELITAIECKRSGEFNKPILIYNSFGYYDKLFEFLEKLYSEEFTPKSVKDCYYIATTIEESLNYIKTTF